MTNGDMIKEVFPECTVRWATTNQIGVTMNNNQCGVTVFDYSWWQSECLRNIMIEQTAQWDILECATHYKRCLCSNCKTPAYVPSKYCPNCGCRMIAEAHYKDDEEFEEMYGKVNMNKMDRVTNYIYGMFDKENVRVEIQDCVQNDCYMDGSVDSKIVIYNISNCSKSLLNQTERCLHSKHGVTCVTHFDPCTNSGTIKVLIKGDESEESL